jgi:osmotically-inducible protein OsmY
MNKLSRLAFFPAFIVLVAAIAVAQTQGTNAAQSTNPQDQKIQQAVQKVIADHPSFKNVQSSVDDRIVTLTGTVDVYADKLRAGDAVRHVDGADGVRNHITVNTQKIADQQLESQLADKLRYDRVDQGIMFNNFTLNVQNGQVTIGGTARTDTDAASALSIVEHQPGVTDVVDNIQVAPTSINDDDIRVRTARAIYGNPALQKYAMDPQAPIRIVVVNGHVTLDGIVDSQMDKTIAANQARSVPGVFSVTDNLQIANKTSAKNSQ